MKFTGERYLPDKEGILSLQHYHRYEFVNHIIKLKNKIVLDIACGEGYGSLILGKNAKKVYGVDISEESIVHAKNKYSNKNIDFLIGDVTKIPLEDNSVDIVVSFETIEHHDRHREMLSEIKRVLKPNSGILIISSPDKLFYEKNYPDSKNEFHIKELYKDEFHQLLKEHFEFNYYYLQNNVFGSIIARETQEKADYSDLYYFNKDNKNYGKLQSRFNISISANQSLDMQGYTSIYTYDILSDPYSELITMQKNLESITNSRSWCLYNIIMKPLRKVKKIFS
ncbi:MAG TPA: methyltransferase domain-containing protein [Bacteroidales bacterium]|nr:class I SAM-dependent methyltransferase [Bacteroidales bacterium]HOE38860.1 methyltransferase domain-containing protein [Bacteroidales bacterium]HPL04532.1 methyltransferase domain-containing protein [Bacteroidales bacterium]